MAEESAHVIRSINWREVFPFTHLFRTFRVAVHPSKLFLALAALMALYIGGRVLDGIWRPLHRAVPGEIREFEQMLYGERPENADLNKWRENRRKQATENYARMLPMLAPVKQEKEFQDLKDPENARKAAAELKYIPDVKFRLRSLRDEQVQQAHDNFRKAEKQDQDAIDRRNREIRETYTGYAETVRNLDTLKGEGLFAAFFEYQTAQINNVVGCVTAGNWLGNNGVVWSTIRFFTVAPVWALQYHWVYFLLFGALFMVVWSALGGAISRIAAVHVADEGRKLSIRQGLSFSISKFLSFLSAPLIPLAIVLVIGLALALAGWLAFWLRLNIVVGVFFVLALAAGIVMTLVLLGTFGGFGLMYPTIAVEGSDSFDAISRSFSYVYAKPWRMLFYSLVAIAYGALTYLFIRLFIWLTLALTHFFVGLWVMRDAVEGVGLWNAMYPPPQFTDLPYTIGFAYLNGYSSLTAFFIAFWNYLLIAMLGAFAISFYFSANTIIYYLMRREVDATEMDDVYLEQPEEDFVETPAAPAAPAPAAATPAATPALTEPAPAATPPADSESKPE